MRRGWPVWGALIVATATASEPTAPRLVEPLPFDHAEHADAFDDGGVSCVHCHPVGARVPLEQGTGAPAIDLEPSHELCHGCHQRELDGAPRRAPGECATCHAERILPPSHTLGWLEAHGFEARARGATCRDCHEPETCATCHDQRGAGARSPHPPGFGTFHGVEARLDPASCSTCHTADRCVDCHATGATPW